MEPLTQDEQMANLLRMRGWKVEAPNSPTPVGDETETLRAADTIAADFAEIPFENHEAKKLALAYIELKGANQWLRDDVTLKAETIAAAEARVAGLETKNKELRKALAPFIPAGPRYLSIGSINNEVEVRVSREKFEKARDLLYD